MNLHDVKLPGLAEALVWGYVRGGNGRMIGGQLHHAFLAERSAPHHPIGDVHRRYWMPWGYGVFTKADPLTPLCGHLRSNARFAQIISTHHWTAQPTGAPHHACPDCLRIGGGNIRYLNDLQRQDPWSLVDHNERIVTVDPISGL